jgi:hypothetical protein
LVIQRLSQGELKVGFVLVVRVGSKRDTSVCQALPISLLEGIQVANDQRWYQPKSQRVVRTTIGTEYGVIGVKKPAGSVKIRQQPVCEDQNSP